MDERREEERKDVSLEVRWEGGSGRHTARVSDLSLGGCFVNTRGQVNTGELVGLEIQLPSGEWLQLRGEVFNLFNHPNFRTLVTNLSATNFGALTQTDDPRVFQFGVKILF